MSKKIISESIFKHIEAAKNIDKNLIQKASDILISTVKSGNSVFWMGNGGSASQANHLSAELVGGMFKNKKSPFRSICLNTDTAFITAWSNDDTFDNIFTRLNWGLKSFTPTKIPTIIIKQDDQSKFILVDFDTLHIAHM